MQQLSSDDVTDLLVAHALGALEAAEVVRLQQLLNQQPELRHTVAEFQTAANYLPLALPDAPLPSDLRQRALDHAVGRNTPRRATEHPPAHRVRSWLFALSGALVLALVAMVLALTQLGQVRTEFAAAQQQLETLQNRQDQIVQAVADPTGFIALRGAAGKGSVVRASDNSLLIAAQLPELPIGRVYQLWLVDGTAIPVSGGTFTVDTNGFGTLTIDLGQLPGDVTFAVTSEPAPGSPTPTSDVLISGVSAS